MTRSLHTADMTAADHRAAAQASRERVAESWERSDTDGFLSQWAGGMTAREHDAWADLLDNGGTVQTRALFHLDGTVASTHSAWGQWGPYWVLNDEATERFGKRFFSESRAATVAKRQATHARKGFAIGWVEVEGYVTMAGGGTGLSGCATAYVGTFPSIDALREGRYTVVSTSDADYDPEG